MNIAVFGANGGTGRLIVRQATEAGHTVTAVTRHPETFPIAHERLQVLAGDVNDLSDVERAIDGAEAVISTLGVPYSRKPITIYSRGTGNIVGAMRSHGIRRLLCVSSSATDPATRYHDTGGGFLFERVLKPIITTTIGKQTYADMLRMERLVMASGLDWTIARPSGLFETDAVTAYETAEGFLPRQYTSRADLADALLRASVDADGRWVGKTMAVGTVDPQPRVLDLMRTEAFQRG
ncbi:NAD(P)-dependent oxidoreductase [Leifsonia sp. NPDC058230]|uniref:NAD(P)-dependent oxidoreductase n=1 Tax=Leifsonia sp. NPDC058230 TaxID=3346391 RepID=UPI0036DE78E8